MTSSLDLDAAAHRRLARLREREGDDMFLAAAATSGTDSSGTVHLLLDATRRVIRLDIDRLSADTRTEQAVTLAVQEAWTVAEVARLTGCAEASPRRAEYEAIGRGLLDGTWVPDTRAPFEIVIPPDLPVGVDLVPPEPPRPAPERTGTSVSGRVVAHVDAGDRPVRFDLNVRWLLTTPAGDLAAELLDALTDAGDS